MITQNLNIQNKTVMTTNNNVETEEDLLMERRLLKSSTPNKVNNFYSDALSFNPVQNSGGVLNGRRFTIAMQKQMTIKSDTKQNLKKMKTNESR